MNIVIRDRKFTRRITILPPSFYADQNLYLLEQISFDYKQLEENSFYYSSGCKLLSPNVLTETRWPTLCSYRSSSKAPTSRESNPEVETETGGGGGGRVPICSKTKQIQSDKLFLKVKRNLTKYPNYEIKMFVIVILGSKISFIHFLQASKVFKT